jgi:K+-sensing histidine kinase KdpD
MTASLSRASASLAAAAAVLDKVQTARQLEGDVSLDSSTALVAVRIDDCIDRLGLKAVSLALEPGLTLRQDWTYVDLILANLLENADRYREPGTIIQVSTETATLVQGQGVLLVTRNRRMSRSVVDADKVFEKYWREAHSRSHRGAGLGLWLSRHAARALGGDLVCRMVGPDIEFTLSLPNR